MATIKIKFRPSSVRTKEGSVCYRVTHRRVTKQITSGHRLFPSEWDAAGSEVILPECDENRKAYLIQVKHRMENDLLRLRKIIATLEIKGEDYTPLEVIGLYLNPEKDHGFLSYARRLIDRLEKTGKVRTAETYTSALNSFVRFYGDTEVPLVEVNSDLMIGYESYLRAEGLCRNSFSFYARNLRAIYNRAVDEGLTPQRFPFKHVYTGIAKTVKRAIPLKEIRSIKEMDLSDKTDLDYARDMFLISFYTRGMSIIDMAYLKKSDLSGGILSYRRKKTGQPLFIKWEKPMQQILDKYDVKNSSYLLPILGSDGGDTRKKYRNKAHFINGKLKQIGRRLRLPIPLTLYCARHSWGSIAKSKHIPISVISQGMGHDSEKTTLIYLASLDTTAVDKANSLILQSL